MLTVVPVSVLIISDDFRGCYRYIVDVQIETTSIMSSSAHLHSLDDLKLTVLTNMELIVYVTEVSFNVRRTNSRIK